MKAGDVAAMPADIRHKGYSPKRSMLIVWENNDGPPAAACTAKRRVETLPRGILIGNTYTDTDADSCQIDRNPTIHRR